MRADTHLAPGDIREIDVSGRDDGDENVDTVVVNGLLSREVHRCNIGRYDASGDTASRGRTDNDEGEVWQDARLRRRHIGRDQEWSSQGTALIQQSHTAFLVLTRSTTVCLR